MVLGYAPLTCIYLGLLCLRRTVIYPQVGVSRGTNEFSMFSTGWRREFVRCR